MACSRLSSLPPELKLEIYFYVCHIDLLPLSHVSKYWRSIVLHDGRWNKWFEMIINTQDGKCLGEIMERFKILDVIPKRTIVTLCFNTKCSQCRRNTPFLFLPLLQRVCDRCLYSDQTYNVIGLSSALVIYDLSERDVREMVVLHWEKTDPEKNTKNITKLVSRLAAENVAYTRDGDCTAFDAYEKRLHAARSKEEDFITDMVYREISRLATNFLIFDASTGCLMPQKLVKCKLCDIMAESYCEDLLSFTHASKAAVRLMLSGLLPDHEQKVHYAVEGRVCREGCSDSMGILPRCKTCLNAEALAIKANLVADGRWDD